MSFEVKSSGPLTGRISIPGDRRLTLTALAFAMLSDEKLTLLHPSPSPDVADFLNFLERNGAVTEHTNETLSLQGTEWSDTVLITDEVPDSVFHCVVGSTVFSCRSVKISNGAGTRSHLLGSLFELLHSLGLPVENISEDGEDIMIYGDSYSPPEIVYSGSVRDFETVIAAAFSVQSPVVVSYPARDAVCSMRLFELLGCRTAQFKGSDDHSSELSRRFARATGSKSHIVQRFEPAGTPVETLRIPGDTTIAAAVCGTAAILGKSDITVKGILWEQGRRGFFDALKRMKVSVDWKQKNGKHSFSEADIRVRWSKSEGIHLSPLQAQSMASELLILAAVSAFAGGKSVISDDKDSPENSRESFRLLARGLEMLGVHVGDYSEGIVLHGGRELRGVTVDAGNSSDVALALTTAALNAAGTTIITGYDNSRYPVSDFLSSIRELASELQLQDN